MKDKSFWVSFSEKDGPLGVCIVDSCCPGHAVLKTWELSINPGGQVFVYPLEEDAEELRTFKKDFLYTPENMENRGYKSTKPGKEEIIIPEILNDKMKKYEHRES